MSRIYFHSEQETAELRGSERAYMGMFCGRLLVATLEPIDRDWHETGNPIRKLIPTGHYLHTAPKERFADNVRIWLTASLDGALCYQDTTVSNFDAALNTALMIGNAGVKLMARLHGQCEIHCYVEGPHRAWLAGIMEQGRACNLFRADQGWEGVIALLRSRTDGPVVCSYSVCEQFPNAGVARNAGLWEPPMSEEYPDEADWDTWYDLPQAERWRLGMAALRQEPAQGLELTPENWQDSYLGRGISGLDLRAWIDTDS